MYHPEALEPMVAFLRGIGMGVEYGEGAHNGFLPGVNIHAGVLHIDPNTLLGSGDLLHEAGHIILVPRRYWSRLGTDLQTSIETLIAEETGPDKPEDPQLRRAAQMGEFMSQAWSYAVVRHLGLPPASVFFPGTHHRHQYEGAHPMLEWLERGTHHGPMALAQAGMTGFSGAFSRMGDNGLPPFPHMTRWSVD